MSRKIPQRISALLWAALFLLSTVGEGFGLQPCPYHDGFFDVEAESDASGGHDHHAAEDIDLGDSHRSHGNHADGEPCTHVEACQVATGAVLPVGVNATVIFTRFVAEGAQRAPVERIAIQFPPFFLPYSNAPPALG